MIYVPADTTFDKCYVVQSEGVIRGYDRTPSYNTIYNYRDYYIDSSYIYRDGAGQWSQYSTLPVCLDNNVITNDYLYRNDIVDILLLFLILAFILIYCPYRLFARIFGKWLRV